MNERTEMAGTEGVWQQKQSLQEKALGFQAVLIIDEEGESLKQGV